MDNERIQSFIESLGGDSERLIRDPPAASHMGGIWGRQISKHGKSLDEEYLLTLVAKTEGILNSWL